MSPQRKPVLDSYENFTRHLEDREFFGQKLGLERIQAVLERLGHPERKFESIHIAGTNGKGSTAAMIAAILSQAGFRTGLYTSPHLTDFCERIRFGDQQISPDEVIHYARMVQEVEGETPLTFFEMATAIAFLHFAEKRVEIAVIETGLGGRLDATNVVKPLVSVITSIGMDHTAHLGKTLSEIAFEKAGIIKEGVPVVLGAVPPEAMEVIREVASMKKGRFVPLFMDLIPPNILINLEGRHQRRNANIAMAVMDVLRAECGISVDREAVWRGLAEVRWPGRLETIFDEPWILLDGAHNVAAMQAVREFIEEKGQGRKVTLLFSGMADKDLKGILEEIAPVVDDLFLVPLPIKRGATVEQLAQAASFFEKSCAVAKSVEEAMDSVLATVHPDEILLITGSFYLIGEVKKWMAKNS
jgi:dihydrofolate synthase/folylpolyglutamate synthase